MDGLAVDNLAPVRQWLQQTVIGLVDNHAAVIITNKQLQTRTVFTISCDPADLGKIIGKSGRTVRSLRTILSAIAKGQGLRCEIDIWEEKIVRHIW